jgi:hypothetical protein
MGNIVRKKRINIFNVSFVLLPWHQEVVDVRPAWQYCAFVAGFESEQ